MSSVTRTASAFVAKSRNNIVEANITPARGLAITGRRLTMVSAGIQGRGGRRKRRACFLFCPDPRSGYPSWGRGALLASPGLRYFEVEGMPPLLSMSSKMTQYLLGDLTTDESQRIEKAIPLDYSLRREIETTEEELIAAYVVGTLRGQARSKFETVFLTTDHRRRKLKFAEDWVERGGDACPDINSPFHRYLLGQMTLDEADEFEETLLYKGRQLDRLGAAVDDLLIAYFHGRLPNYQKKLFETNFLPLKSAGMLGKIRFAQIMFEYERASVAPSPTPENAVGAGRRRLRKRPGTTCARSRIGSR